MGLALPLPTLGPDLCLILQGTMGFPDVMPASILKGKEGGDKDEGPRDALVVMLSSTKS